MGPLKNLGVCYLCKQNIAHRVMTKHLGRCIEQQAINDTSAKNEKEKVFLIKISAGKEFWLYVEVNGSSTLEDLDYFLRKTWLECCGHMSQFRINGKCYSCNGNMEKVIHRTLPVGAEFDYDYDFGDTTELKGVVLASRQGELLDGIRLLAQNHLPEYVECESCKKFPFEICTSCYGFFCEACQKEHITSCAGEDTMLPVVNSPRMGVCGYSGPDNEWR